MSAFLSLVRKNLIIKKRGFIGAILSEILIPALLAGVMYYSITRSSKIPELTSKYPEIKLPTDFVSLDIRVLPLSACQQAIDFQRSHPSLSVFPDLSCSITNEDEFLRLAYDGHISQSATAIVFSDDFSSYKVRNGDPKAEQLSESVYGAQYLAESFLEWRKTQVHAPAGSFLLGTAGSFPMPLSILTGLVSLFFPICLLAPLMQISSSVVGEREKKFRALLFAQGMRFLDWFASWFVTALMFTTLPCLIVSIGLFASRGLPGLDFTILILALILFTMACSGFVLATSSPFQTVRGAVTATQVLLIVFPLFLPSNIFQPFGVMARMITLIVRLEKFDKGATWSNVGKMMSYGDGSSSVLQCFGILVLHVVVWWGLFLIVELLRGGQPRRGARTSKGVGNSKSPLVSAKVAQPMIPTADEEKTVFLRNLTKIYYSGNFIADFILSKISRKEKIRSEGYELSPTNDLQRSTDDETHSSSSSFTALSSVSFPLYSSEIFALLGHNGAGKSTLLNILTGVTSSTLGEVIGATRTGYCAQEDIIWPSLTVKEHLELVAGLRAETNSASTLQLAHDVGLSDKLDAPAFALSGGMKRRLSLAMAFAGDAKLVVLDECTSGLDPYTRRSVWGILKRMRQGRVIVLSTHFLDEAESLSDRVGVMNQGKLVAYGTPDWLKHQYDCGYTVDFDRSGAMESTVTRAADHSEMVETTPSNSIIPRILQLASGSGCTGAAEISESSIRLPFASRPSFPQFFAAVDAQSESLGIKGYSLSAAKLEEVFVKITEGSHPSQPEAAQELSLTSRPWFFMQALCSAYPSLARLRLGTCVLKLFIPAIVIALVLFVTQGAFAVRSPIPAATSIRLSVFTTEDCDSTCVERVMKEAEIPNFEIRSHILNDSNVSHKSLISMVKLAVYQSSIDADLFMAFTRGHTFALVASSRSNSMSSGALHTALRADRVRRSVPSLVLSLVATQAIPMAKREESIQLILSSLAPLAVLATQMGSSVGRLAFSANADSAVCKQMKLSGMSSSAYWVGRFAADYLGQFVIAASAVSLALYYISPIFNSAEMVALLFLFGLAAIPLSYLFSMVCKTPAGTQKFFLVLNGLSACILGLAGTVLRLVAKSQEEFQAASVWVNLVGGFFPGYYLYAGALELVFGQIPMIGLMVDFDVSKHIKGLGLLAIGYTALLLAVEVVAQLRLILSARRAAKIEAAEDVELKDPSVLAEEAKASNGSPLDFSLLIRGVKKTYTSWFSNPVFAVRGISLALKPGERFGLLGLNGAGKTTAVHCAIGSEAADSGRLFVAGNDLAKSLSACRKNIGFCAQSDCLIPELTVRETVRLFARIRGVHKPSETAERLIATLGLSPFAHVQSGRLSGGNKRKLCVAQAVIGDPSVVFLDEASSGMDPLAMRMMWKVIKGLSVGKTPRTVIITTHSMEEAEALSMRLGIMKAGQFLCVGSIAEIRESHGIGWEANLKMREPSAEETQEVVEKLRVAWQSQTGVEYLPMEIPMSFSLAVAQGSKFEGIEEEFGSESTIQTDRFVSWLSQRKMNRVTKQWLNEKLGGEVVEERSNLMRFLIPGRLADVFGQLESGNEDIADFSVTQVSLEQIFNRFAQRS